MSQLPERRPFRFGLVIDSRAATRDDVVDLARHQASLRSLPSWRRSSSDSPGRDSGLAPDAGRRARTGGRDSAEVRCPRDF